MGKKPCVNFSTCIPPWIRQLSNEKVPEKLEKMRHFPIGSKGEIACMYIHGKVLYEHRTVGASRAAWGVEDTAVWINSNKSVRQRHGVVYRLFPIPKKGIYHLGGQPGSATKTLTLRSTFSDAFWSSLYNPCRDACSKCHIRPFDVNCFQTVGEIYHSLHALNKVT